MYKRCYQSAIVMLLSFFISLVWAQKLDFPVYQYQLANGLKALIKVDKRSPAVMVQVWYRVGSSDERLGETGISHYLEHMMFQGSTIFPPGKLKEIIAVNGGEQNAFTSRDYTVYFELMSADQLSKIFELEADRMQNLSFSANQFNSEKKVIQEERRMRVGDSPLSYTLEKVHYVSNMASPYANPVIGWPGDLKQMTIRQIYNWYFKWYGPNNVTLVVVGDVQPKQVEKQIQHYFGGLKSVVTQPTRRYPLLKTTGPKQVVIRRPGAVPALVMTYRVPSEVTASDKKNVYALIVAADLLAGMHSARLEKDLVRDQQLATSISISYHTVAKYPTSWTIIARPAKGVSLPTLQAAIESEINQLAYKGPSKTELKRVIKVVQARHIYQLDELFGQAYQLGSLECVGLSWKLGNQYVSNIGKVTAEQVRAVLSDNMGANNLTVGEYYPLKEKQSTQVSHEGVTDKMEAYS